MNIRELIEKLSGLGHLDGEVSLDLLRSLLPVDGLPLSKPTHEDFESLLDDIRSFVKDNPGATVLPSDDPSSLLVGFTAFKAGDDGEISKLFSIRIHNLKPSLSARPSLATAGGRRELCQRLMSGS